jgi:hypothetical protein
MRRHWPIKVLGVLLFVTIFIAGFGSGAFFLWNMMMPAIFGLPVITFWQAVGLLALSWLFFGGWRGMGVGRHRHWGPGMRARWAAMTPEQREQFAKGLGTRCGGASVPAAE